MIRYVRASTRSPAFPEGIPIYVDPVGLQEAEVTTSTTRITSPAIAFSSVTKPLLDPASHDAPEPASPPLFRLLSCT